MLKTCLLAFLAGTAAATLATLQHFPAWIAGPAFACLMWPAIMLAHAMLDRIERNRRR